MCNQAETTEREFRKKCLTEAGIAYSAGAVLPVLLTFFVAILGQGFGGADYVKADWYKYLTYLVPQVGFCVVVAIYFKRTKEPLNQTYRVCKWYYFLVALVLQFGLFCLSDLNGLFLLLLRKLGYTQAETSLPTLAGWNLLPAVLVIALLPALFEETIFRGILARNMRQSGWGTAATVLISGAMFSLYHGNPAQTLYQFACGACYALVAVRSGSILPTMAAHFVNNAIILCLLSAGIESMPVHWAWYLFTVLALIASMVYLIFFDKNNRSKGGVKDGKYFFLAAAVGFAVCAAEWLIVLITGFAHA